MPNVDLAVWASRAYITPPGGVVGGTLASTTTIAPVNPITYVSGTSAISSITLPFTGFIGELTLIPTGAWTTTTDGNIARAMTAVANQAVEFVFDGTSWFPLAK